MTPEGERQERLVQLCARFGVAVLYALSQAATMHLLVGYRNRLVHFYREVSAEELYQVCFRQLGDIEFMQDAYQRWFQEHPEKLDQTL